MNGTVKPAPRAQDLPVAQGTAAFSHRCWDWAAAFPSQAARDPPCRAFDDIDAGLHDEEDHLAHMELPTEDEQMPEPAQESDEEGGKNQQPNGTIIPRWDVGLDEDQCATWAEAEKSLKCYRSSDRQGGKKGEKKKAPAAEAPPALYLEHEACLLRHVA